MVSVLALSRGDNASCVHASCFMWCPHQLFHAVSMPAVSMLAVHVVSMPTVSRGVHASCCPEVSCF